MLYVLPPRAQSGAAPWSNGAPGMLCNNNNEPPNNWNGTRRPPRVRLRNLVLHKDENNKIGGAIGQDEVDNNRNPKSLSECYFAGKGTALVLPDAEAHKSNSRRSGGGQGSSHIQKHLQSMFYLLAPEETLKMAVKLESVHPARTRYLVVVSRPGSRNDEESCLLGIDCNEKTTVGLVLKVLADTKITLDGDGGFSVTVCGRHHIFKPVSVQAMWSALQTLHKVSAKAREQTHFQGGLTHSWVSYYEQRIESDRSCLNEWHAMDNLESKRPPSPDSIRTKPTAREETEQVIRTTLKEIMMSVDLDEVTSKVIRSRLEEELDMDLGEYKPFIDREMLVILGQMDAPTEIFDHVYLGSEWNASNYEELQKNGVGHILNVTREIDNFFPGTFDYLNVRVYDDEKTDLLKHWDDTFKYITKARDNGSKVLVHCKMGVSRSASVVIAYAMKAYNWDFGTAMKHVKEKRNCIKPNTSFLSQLETYQGMLVAMKNKEKLQRSKSETNLKSPNESPSKPDKVLVGSAPTPMVQALSKSYDQNALSGQELKLLGTRPKSWSPDNLATRELGKQSPFLSLEDLSQKSGSKESVLNLKVTQARHVLMPCDNGESYSVSPNQIVHLPGLEEARRTKLVSNLTSKFEEKQQQQQKSDSSCNFNNNEVVSGVKEATWDPGEELIKDPKLTENCDNFSMNEPCVWTSSMVVQCLSETSQVPESQNKSRKDSDPFSNQLDRVFDREEKRRGAPPPVLIATDEDKPRDCPSRQSSWSSYDSAVGFPMNEPQLSRHSSWGSGDTRTLPSRNSSWGSYDLRPRGPVHYINERGEKVQHEDERKTPSSETLLFVDDERRIGPNITSAKIDIPSCDYQSSGRLSNSAPEPSSMELISQDCSLSRSLSQESKPNPTVKIQRTFLENLQKDSQNNLKKQDDFSDTGKVRNLKKEFEAKSGSNQPEDTGKPNSLPSSPVSQHQRTEDVSFQSLRGFFEKQDEAQVNLRQKNLANKQFTTPARTLRHSCIEVSVEKSPVRITQTPLINNLSKSSKNDEFKRPPMVPVVRTAPQNFNMVTATVIATATQKKQQKKQQQYGRSHPLSMLNMPRHTNPVYNTM